MLTILAIYAIVCAFGILAVWLDDTNPIKAGFWRNLGLVIIAFVAGWLIVPVGIVLSIIKTIQHFKNQKTIFEDMLDK